MNIYSTSDAADRIGVPVRRIQRFCERHGIGVRVGKSIALSEADVKRLRKLISKAPLRHKFPQGNDFWKLGKSTKKDADTH